VSLQGNLEDLPLLDILQIVAFSQKTGFLTVQAAPGEAALVFERGLIVSSYTWDVRPLDATELPQEKRSAVIRGRIEVALERLSRLREGSFSFELTAEPVRMVGGRDLAGETLTDGLNPQELLLDLARGIDEDRRDSVAAVESAFVEPEPAVLERVAAQPATEADDDVIVVDSDEELAPLPVPASVQAAAQPAPPVAPTAPVAPMAPAAPVPPAAVPPPAPETSQAPETPDRHRILLLLEDEEDVRRQLADAFIRAGHQVVEAEDPLSAARKGRGLADVGLPFVLVADRGMPTSDSSSFDGGLEAVKRLRQAGLHPPVLLMTDRMNHGLHARARKLGVTRFVFKPGLTRLDPAQFQADILAFAGRMLEGILPQLEDIAEAPESAAPTVAVALPRRIENWDEVAALQRRLEELQGPSDAFKVSTLVMKVAREFFERAVLFVVKGEELRGLSGFGPAMGEEISLLARELVIPLVAPSVFEQVVATGRSFAGPLQDAEWSRLDQRLGRFAAKAVALVPLLAHRETIALLLADNPDTGTELRSLETLEVFLNQAGLALENAFLVRKIKARMGEDGLFPPSGSDPGALTGLQDVDGPGPDPGRAA
jgi:CheY-like chemotaxis protein